MQHEIDICSDISHSTGATHLKLLDLSLLLSKLFVKARQHVVNYSKALHKALLLCIVYHETCTSDTVSEAFEGL